jgi:hypothetical protein
LAQSNVILLLTNHSEYRGISQTDLDGKILIDPSGAVSGRRRAP